MQMQSFIRMEEINECTKRFSFIDYMQTSAKSGENVKNLFKTLADNILKMEREAKKL